MTINAIIFPYSNRVFGIRYFEIQLEDKDRNCLGFLETHKSLSLLEQIDSLCKILEGFLKYQDELGNKEICEICGSSPERCNCYEEKHVFRADCSLILRFFETCFQIDGQIKEEIKPFLQWASKHYVSCFDNYDKMMKPF
jgi:hypothetical protein